MTGKYGTPAYLNNKDITVRNIFEVQSARYEYYMTRLALVEERIFSHVKDFARPKLTRGQRPTSQTIIHNINSAVGKLEKIWVFGILTRREDTNYYLEDNTFSIKLSFQELEYADPDAFFTENSILLIQGYYDNNELKVIQMEHPPMHARRSITYKVNEQDYFGAYAKLQR